MRSVAAALFVMLLVGCGGDPPVATDGSTTSEAAAGPGPTEHCGEVETVPIQGEGHLVGDQEPPVAYNSTPPTSGWHASGDVAFVVADESDPLTEPEQVTVLELEGVVVTYNGLDDDARQQLADLVGTKYAGVAAMTSYDALGEGEVALTAWGRLQLCDAVDLPAVEAFITAFATAEPDQG